MRASQRPTGIISAVATPTSDEGELDEQGLRSIVTTNTNWGVHGLAVSIVAGEFFKFTDQERLRSFEIVIDQSKSGTPVWAGVNHIGTEPAVELARRAKDAGAAGVIAMPPLAGPKTDGAMHEHFSELLGKVDIPLMVQDSEDFAGIHIRTNLYAELKKEHSNLVSVKIEGGDTLNKIEDALGTKGLEKVSILGGMGGRLLLQELQLGAHGSIPASCLTDILVEIYDRYRDGQHSLAKKLFAKYRPWLEFISLYSPASAEVQKETLRLRGVIKSSQTRNPRVPLTNEAKRQLAKIVEDLCGSDHSMPD